MDFLKDTPTIFVLEPVETLERHIRYTKSNNKANTRGNNILSSNWREYCINLCLTKINITRSNSFNVKGPCD